jgi:prepilin-type N-terminal cleavage/methylation domain-containing protein
MKSIQRGFTLLELIVVVTIVGILLGLAAPSFVDFLRNNRMAAAANDLLTAVNVARTEAIKRREPVTICAVADPTDDEPVCDEDGDFETWVVFVDADTDPDSTAVTDGDAQFDPDQGEILIRTSSPARDTLTSYTSTYYIQFGLDGFQQRNDGTAPTDEAIRLCDERGDVVVQGDDGSAARALTVSRTGRAGVTRLHSVISDLGGCSAG